MEDEICEDLEDLKGKTLLPRLCARSATMFDMLAS
jgi:hypothetical protein